jgi:hypothetical protein
VPVNIPPFQTTQLDNFTATYVFPTPFGLLFYGNPGMVSQPTGPSGATALYYDDATTWKVEAVAIPTPSSDGVQRGIESLITAGDWAIYEVADSTSGRWEVWALNLATMTHKLVASAADEHSQLSFFASFVTDGITLVWFHLVPANGGGVKRVLNAYDLATGQSRVLRTTAGFTSTDNPVAMANGTFVFEHIVSITPTPQSGDTATTSTWLWKLTDAGPQQILANAGLSYTMNDRFIVWDNIHGYTLTLYDRQTGKEADYFVSDCIRPRLAQTRPYLVCVDFNASSYRLVRLPSGDNATFFDHQAASDVIFTASDRACWVVTPANDPYGHAVDCFDMPAS